MTRGIVDWYLEHQQEELDQGRELFMTDTRIMNHIMEIMIAGHYEIGYFIGDVRRFIHYFSFVIRTEPLFMSPLGRKTRSVASGSRTRFDRSHVGYANLSTKVDSQAIEKSKGV